MGPPQASRLPRGLRWPTAAARWRQQVWRRWRACSELAAHDPRPALVHLAAPRLSRSRSVRVEAAKKNGPKKVVLAYSGGLDTSIILKWLQDEYGCEVVTFTADLGQVGTRDCAVSATL